MKRLFTLLLACIVSMPILFAQSKFKRVITEEGKIYLLPRQTDFKFEMPEISYKDFYKPASTFKLDMKLPDFEPEISIFSDERPMDMQILSGAYKPFFNIYTPLYLRINPMALDYFEAYRYPIDENFSFSVSGIQTSWPGSGSINTVSAIAAWNNEKFEIWGGGFAGRYSSPYEISPGVMAGGMGGVNYQPAEWIKLKTWASYTHYDHKGRDNMFLYLNNFIPRTVVGGAMEFKVNENFGFGFGMQYNLNPMRNRWDNEKFIYPVIKRGTRFGISVN